MTHVFALLLEKMNGFIFDFFYFCSVRTASTTETPNVFVEKRSA